VDIFSAIDWRLLLLLGSKINSERKKTDAKETISKLRGQKIRMKLNSKAEAKAKAKLSLILLEARPLQNSN
jgi:hypothetical protein